MQVLFYIFLVFTALQLIYFLCIFSRVIFYKTKKQERVQEGVSVIVAARNEKENLKQLIPALLQQHYEQFEIILVDDRSEDGTADFLNKEYQDIKLKVLSIGQTPQGWNPKKYALQKGIEAAQYDQLVFTDADCIPNSTRWITAMVQKLKVKQLVLGYSPYKKAKGLLNLFIRFETMFTAMQYFSFAISGIPYMGVGRNIAYRKPFFYKENGFNPVKSVTGGDDDLFVNKVATAKNTGVALHEDSFVTSIPETTFGKWLKQKKRHLSVGNRYSFKSKLLLGGFIVSLLGFYCLFGILLVLGGYHKMLLAIYLSRWIVVSLIFFLISGKLKDHINILVYSLLEILYIAYLTWGGIWTSISTKKRITWK